jgi:hypothetical protein
MHLPSVLKSVAMGLLILSAAFSMPGVGPVSASGEEDIDELRDELNETKRQLAEAEKERDDYRERLEEQTNLLYIVLVLLILSYVSYFLIGRRQKAVLMELQARTGVSLDDPRPRPRRRRRG